jgi:hypothetical protein
MMSDNREKRSQNLDLAVYNDQLLNLKNLVEDLPPEFKPFVTQKLLNTEAKLQGAFDEIEQLQKVVEELKILAAPVIDHVKNPKPSAILVDSEDKVVWELPPRSSDKTLVQAVQNLEEIQQRI